MKPKNLDPIMHYIETEEFSMVYFSGGPFATTKMTMPANLSDTIEMVYLCSYTGLTYCAVYEKQGIKEFGVWDYLFIRCDLKEGYDYGI